MLKEDIAFIDDLGGTVSVAKICEITKGAVSQWRKNGIPKAQLKFLSLKFPVEYQRVYGNIEPVEKDPASSGSLNDCVNARELHAFLESRQDFSTWIKRRVDDYGFLENQDFVRFHKNRKQICLKKICEAQKPKTG